ncbi:hypothetical protein L1D37_23140 [Vibrio sp. Isolate33]|uniref:hypothetical protein n=1 Tax=Vibrio sp. Isolate33 TaxID=2908539 RepID=UPI001EFE3172|nr:hypothetical protein [Vibrio sp. Isolate33]MCG9546643.1 hypothetical protein [Vibrio sp. Isolate33]
MAKRFCKLNRRDITEHLGEIHSLVTQPKFVCRSCARSSADEANLCKPTAIPPLGCQNKPVEEKAACGLLAETLPKPEITLAEVVDTPDSAVQMFDPSVASIAKKPSLKKAKLKKLMANSGEKKELKRAKKAAKKQEKYNKKLAKMIKKQQKLFKKSQKMESKLERINLQLDDVVFTESPSMVANHIH